MAICWERVVLLTFHLCCFIFDAILKVCVPFPFGVLVRMCNVILSLPDYFLVGLRSRRVVSLSKALYSPKVLVNYPGSGGSVPTGLKNC